MKIKLNFGQKLRELRKNSKLTIERLSKKSDVSISYITMIENGYLKNDPAEETVEKLTAVLGQELKSYTKTSSTNALKEINQNPADGKKIQVILEKIFKNRSLLDKILKVVK